MSALFQSNEFVVIKDLKPVATHHFLVLSHKHIASSKSLQPCEQDRNLSK
jgi:diadenosine tetraphosphate (Ap4A) HIT family hydrolase